MSDKQMMTTDATSANCCVDELVVYKFRNGTVNIWQFESNKKYGGFDELHESRFVQCGFYLLFPRFCRENSSFRWWQDAKEILDFKHCPLLPPRERYAHQQVSSAEIPFRKRVPQKPSKMNKFILIVYLIGKATSHSLLFAFQLDFTKLKDDSRFRWCEAVPKV